MSIDRRQVREMSDEEIIAKRKRISSRFGIPMGVINRINHKGACIYLMGTIIDDYMEYMDSAYKTYLLPVTRNKIAFQDFRQATKRWMKTFDMLMVELDGQLIKDNDGKVSKDYEELKGMIDGYLNDEGNKDNWNWQQRYYFSETQRKNEKRELERKIMELEEEKARLVDLLEENKVKIKL